eukprot:5463459-Prymnesium_polylepis.1
MDARSSGLTEPTARGYPMKAPTEQAPPHKGNASKDLLLMGGEGEQTRVRLEVALSTGTPAHLAVRASR